ncbi:hypothetical protein ACQPYK_14410 [Streptosporangium sp. CA-135522]|uniref:hypothetical protein n=1 Tax=Streptosporangium sp. CA-135522 TaxID=3240072 RepID=UPI003D8A9A63
MTLIQAGGHLPVAEYDRFGHAVRGLTAHNRALALDEDGHRLAELAITRFDEPGARRVAGHPPDLRRHRTAGRDVDRRGRGTAAASRPALTTIRAPEGY